MSEVFNPQNRVQSKAKAEARTTAPLKPKAGLNGPPSTALQLGAPGVPSKVSRCGTLFHSVAATLTAALRRRGTFLQQRELQLALHLVDSVQDYAHAVSHGESFPGALADDLARIFMIAVAVVV